MCYQGVWFVSRTANGPWDPAETVPAEIYQIPASSPSHHVTYVTVVEDDDDDEWITYAAVAGYTGMTIAWGCAVWGTGWYYPPYVWHGGFYPVYYPFYPTYGYGAWYNPWTGSLWPRRRVVRAVRRRRSRGAVQPGHGHLRARRGGVGSVRRARRRRRLQPAHWHVRAHAAGIRRVRQLGLHVRAARQPVGSDGACDESLHRYDDTRDAGQRWRRSGDAHRPAGQRRRRPYRQRRRLRRPRWQRLPTWGRRQLAEIRRRFMGIGGEADASRWLERRHHESRRHERHYGQLERDRAARTEGSTRTRDYGTCEAAARRGAGAIAAAAACAAAAAAADVPGSADL